MRFINIPDLRNLILLPKSALVTSILLGIMVVALYIAILMMSYVKLKLPNVQVQTFMKPLMRPVDKTLEMKLAETLVDVNKESRKAQQYENEKIQLQRYRIEGTPEEVRKNGTTGIMMSCVLLIATFMGISTLRTIGTPIWLIVVFVLVMAVIIWTILKKTIFLVKIRKKWLEQDVMYDLYYFLSAYKYADPSTNLFNYMKDAMKTSNSLMVDIIMLLSDMNTFKADIALDNFAMRVNNEFAKRFVSLLKLTLTGGISQDQYKIAVDALASEARTEILKKDDKKRTKRFNATIWCIVLAFAAVCLIYMVKPITEMMVSFKAS